MNTLLLTTRFKLYFLMVFGN